ncbi:MAG: Unknown protein [uncultured Sulfurovum sp.]|uniref:Uncharacterized protein n=1 Tax=uncultured Sulfurovum sp. TaxID=269237 RepID=A0A6S6U2P4_9BACT|nr:MAG: Unknown protein [uncultured Sulfurovum sp.]
MINRASDLEKKLSLYSHDYSNFEVYLFNDEKYKYIADLLYKDNITEVSIKEFNKKFNEKVEIEKGKLRYSAKNLSNFSSELFKLLYLKNKENSFENFIKLIEEKLVCFSYDYWFQLSFEYSYVEEYFLEKARDYIISNLAQKEDWIKDIKSRALNPYYSPTGYIDVSKVPDSFENKFDLYDWSKRDHNPESFIGLGKPLVRSLLHNLIKKENSTLHYHSHFFHVMKILDACSDDYVTLGQLLTSSNIKLNTYFLTQRKYIVYGFLNLYHYKSAPRVSDDDIDYGEHWNKMISTQLINLLFEHFKDYHYVQESSKVVFQILNYIIKKHLHQMNNHYHSKANYILDLLLVKISSLEINILGRRKEFLFDLIVDDLVEYQIVELEKQERFKEENYFLLSWLLEQIVGKAKVTNKQYLEIVEKISNVFVRDIEKAFIDAIVNDSLYIHDEVLEKLNFGLIYEVSLHKDRWLNLLDITDMQKQMSNQSSFILREVSGLFFKILLKIFSTNNYKKIESLIHELAFKLGIHEKYGIFTFREDSVIHLYLEQVNSFSDKYFEDFLTEFVKKEDIKNVLLLYQYTLSSHRKNMIEDKLSILLDKECKLSSFKTMEEIIQMASNNGFDGIKNKFLNIYKNDVYVKGYIKRKDELAEIVYRNELIDIYDDKQLSETEKIEKLNQTKNPFERNMHHLYKKCEEFSIFIRAIIFYDENADKTYRRLNELLEKRVDTLYLYNMLSAYFKMYENDTYKKEKFTYILKRYKELSQKAPHHKKELFAYQMLLYGYTITNNIKEFYKLWEEMPKIFQYDLNIVVNRSEFLENNAQKVEAIAYVKEVKEFHKELSDEDEKSLEKLLADLHSGVKHEVEHKLQARVDLNTYKFTLKDAKESWLQIKNMSNEEHSEIFSNVNTPNEFIRDIMLNISEELLNRKINIQRQKEDTTIEVEDIINDWVTSLLGQRMSYLGWKVKDQVRGGVSASRNGVGEKDLEVFSHRGDKLLLFEAFRLFSRNTTDISSHMNKISGYNATGCQTLVIMVYTYVNNFSNLCEKYIEYLIGLEYDGFDRLSQIKEHTFKEERTSSTNIMLYSEDRFKNEKKIKIYHYLLDFT